jgi:hypothetical protein
MDMQYVTILNEHNYMLNISRGVTFIYHIVLCGV